LGTCFTVYFYRGVDEREEHAECECPQDGPAHDPEYSQGGLHKNTFTNVVFGSKTFVFSLFVYTSINICMLIYSYGRNTRIISIRNLPSKVPKFQEIQAGAVAKSYMTDGLLIYD
jgi:hypothetical protein